VPRWAVIREHADDAVSFALTNISQFFGLRAGAFRIIMNA